MRHRPDSCPQGPSILLTGATGYIGGRLLRALEMDGRRVRCLARRPDVLKGRVAVSTEVVAGDVLNPGSLLPALQGIEVAYYLVHSMGSSGALEEDRRGASHVGRAAREAGVRLVFAGMLRGSVAAIGATPRGRAAAPEREQTL